VTKRVRDDGPSLAAGRLGVHVDGRRPRDVLFAFERRGRRFSRALSVSLLTHAVGILMLVAGLTTDAQRQLVSTSCQPTPAPSSMVWLASPGPGGGGGGGGNRTPGPPRKAEGHGTDRLTVAVTSPVPLPSQPAPAQPESPPPHLIIPARPMAAGMESLPGAIEGVSMLTLSLGPGTGGGAGTGDGPGDGPGKGPGLGPGSSSGTGDGPPGPGGGAENPILLVEVKPLYTADAMRARVQGTALLQCVVQPDGTTSDVRVVRSLDTAFGLDDEAIKAVRRWRFAPARRQGRAVPMLIRAEVLFSLR